MLINDEAKCLCSSGFTGSPLNGACVDLDECASVNPCGPGAICNNEPGTFSCQCPGGAAGDPYKSGCAKTPVPFGGCSSAKPCPNGEVCVRDEIADASVCICQRGYMRDPSTGQCRDRDECFEIRDGPACGINALCKNLPGSYECQCPPGFNGNPFTLCEGKLIIKY